MAVEVPHWLTAGSDPAAVRRVGVARWRLLRRAVAIAGPLAVGVLAVMTMGAHENPVGSAPAGSRLALDGRADWAADGCIEQVSGDAVSGSGVGDLRSGPGVILAFEHAYFVARSGHTARSLTTADAAVPAAEVIQLGIDSTPVGTRYCVQISPAAGIGTEGHERVWWVALTIQYPAQAPTAARVQQITTEDRDGRAFITGIAAGR